MNKICPKCNAVNDDNANFCRYCGSALPKVENTQPNNAPVEVCRSAVDRL